jgi:hypothetical protein
MTSLYIETDGKKNMEAHTNAEFVLHNNSTSVVLYQDDQYTYWAEFKFSQCGKKAKLKSKTFLELRNGEIIDGNSASDKRKIEKGEKDWIVGVFDDTFKLSNQDDQALKAGFTYAMRFSN